MDKFLVRKGEACDAYGITYVNAYTRYSTYMGLMPEKILKTRIDTIEEKAEKVRENIINGGKYLVVENTGTNEIIGMSIYGPSRNDEYPKSGEIYALYILKDYQKLGLGKKLFFAGINELINLGFSSMIINVLEGNNAIKFYEKYGGILVGEKYDQCGKATIKEFILFFEDIKSIIK